MHMCNVYNMTLVTPFVRTHIILMCTVVHVHVSSLEKPLPSCYGWCPMSPPSLFDVSADPPSHFDPASELLLLAGNLASWGVSKSLL